MINGKVSEQAIEWLTKARQYRQHNDLEAAASSCLSSLEIEPWYIEAYLELTAIFRLNGQLQEALSCINKAEERFKDHPWLTIGKGHIFKDLGLHEKALSNYSRSYRLDSNRFEGEIFALELLFELKRFDEYDKRAVKLISLFPNEKLVMLEARRHANFKLKS